MSTGDNFGLVCLVGWGLFFIGLIAVVLWTRRSQRTQWRAVAQQHGLNFTAGERLSNPRLMGVYRGRQLSAKAAGQLFVRYSTRSAQVVVNLPAPVELQLSLSKKTVTRQMVEMAVRPAIHTGDWWLDHLFVVSGQPEARVLALVRSTALRPHLEKSYRFEVEVVGQSLIYTCHEYAHDPQALLDAAVDFAEAVEATFTHAA